MTRLIDADALIQIFEADEKALADLEFQLAAIGAANTVRKMPTVDAIPIEYILKQIMKLERSKGQSYHAICYRHLIEAWAERKEE